MIFSFSTKNMCYLISGESSQVSGTSWLSPGSHWSQQQRAVPVLGAWRGQVPPRAAAASVSPGEAYLRNRAGQNFGEKKIIYIILCTSEKVEFSLGKKRENCNYTIKLSGYWLLSLCKRYK